MHRPRIISATPDAEVPMPAPEESARQQIDDALSVADWAVQDVAEANVHAARELSGPDTVRSMAS